MGWAIGGCTALAAAVSVWRLAESWVLAPFLGLAVVAAALAWIDLTQHRLPNRLVLPALVVSVPLLLGAALLDGDPGAWLTALGGGAALFALYLVLALVSLPSLQTPRQLFVTGGEAGALPQVRG